MQLKAKDRKLIEGIRGRFLFRSRPSAVPPDLRPDWKIAVLVIGLNKSGWGGRMSLKKAHVLNWAVRDDASRQQFIRMIQGERELEDVPVRFDPAFNRALDFAAGEGLVTLERKTTGLIIQLLPKGTEFVEDIEKHPDCLAVERSFFDEIKRVSEERIRELLDWETDS